MTMQIREITLYNAEGDVRHLPFHLGRVNIITGSSKTGKSSLIDIVEYCLGRDPCTVPVGVIRDTVAWYGLLLQFPDTQCFIARRDPGPTARSSSDVYYELGDEIVVPALTALSQNITPRGLIELLSRKLGISPNLHEPPPRSTALPLEANLSHALFLVFQRQDEIAKRTLLFHRQDEQFIPQAIRDTLPYFLGAVQEDHLAKRQDLRHERVELRKLERQAKEVDDQRGSPPQAITLLAEAENVGLIERPEALVTDAQVVELLRGAITDIQDPAAERQAVGAVLTRMRAERTELTERYRRARDQLNAAQTFQRDQSEFTTEITAQHSRLQSIGLFAGDEADISRCPVCESALDVATPGVATLKRSLTDLDAQLTTTKRVRPKLDAHLDHLKEEATSSQQRLTECQRAIDALIAQDSALGERVSTDLQRTYVRGRISQYIQNMKPASSGGAALARSIEAARARVTALEQELRDDDAEDVLTSILILLGRAMSIWAARLKLEHARWPLRIDLSQLTVVADSPNGPIPMSRMGSGENWVGYHLVAHLALHRWFVKKTRPVPHFLFLDQPTQVYYPAERDAEGTLDVLKDEDRAAVRRMFALLFDAVRALAPKFQVIVTDHADLDDDDFQRAVVARWRGDKLIPASWLKGYSDSSSPAAGEDEPADDFDI